MASLNEPALFRIVIEDANGNQYVCHQVRSDGPINAGKSPDGVLANLTIDKQMRLGLAGPIAKGGSKVRVMFKQDSADGLDVSDGVFQLCVTEVTPNGQPISERQLGSSDLGISTDYPAANVAGVWHELGTGYTVPDGMFIRVGSSSMLTPTVLSLEDDTA
jgi:hypothetical protein